MSVEVRLSKIGADPEALFSTEGGQAQNAQNFVGRIGGYSSWIGVDGHAFTAEFRPQPFTTIWRLARNIAEAIGVVDREVLKPKNMRLIAQPWDPGSGEQLGGHIHLSFFVKDPVAAPVVKAGYIYNHNGDMIGVDTHVIAYRDSAMRRRIPALPEAWDRYVDADVRRATFSLQRLKERLAYLVEPLEYSVLPLGKRQNRLYGLRDSLRYDFGPPKWVGPDVFKWRVEYRFPSSWLYHPALALAYLGCAKLVIDNYHLGFERLDSDTGSGAKPQFWTSLHRILNAQKAVVRDDVTTVPGIVRYVQNNLTSKMAVPQVFVDTEAWAQFLETGSWK